MKISSLTYIGFEINAALDSAPDLQLSFEDVHKAAEKQCLIVFLQQKLGAEIDLSLFNLDPVERAATENALSEAAGSLRGRERRKTGVERSGLCLVLAIVFEAIQQTTPS